ncbi:MAG: AAA family ATPase [Alphaproteobacteria bacterium]|nr:AAA family ATPase [Alphaproteobacteria bacterium]
MTLIPRFRFWKLSNRSEDRLKRDGTLESLSPTGRPERPITSESEDRLSRRPFIERLTAALIDPATKKSTGVVIGITGQWGSGKSSILNLLRTHISELYPDSVIVPFDPWLISGRNDLIAQFLDELKRSIDPKSSNKDKAHDIARTLADYGDLLSPALSWIHPGAGAPVKLASQGLRKIAKQDKSLSTLRVTLEKLLAAYPNPIVVLVDELDRVEDHEIRSIAQLVRSVADFPSISYVLAYDPRRVIQALGEGTTSRDRERRGSAYLEKIVQLQIPLPVTFEEELIKLLNAELQKLPATQGMPRDFTYMARYRELIAVLLQGGLETPRDINRLVGTFHALAGMVGNEVDKIDLLGYSALVAKAPRTIQRLRENPEDFTDNIITARALMRRINDIPQAPEDRLKRVLPKDGDQKGTAEILKFLFPVFGSGIDSSERSGDRISLRRPLLTALRLGLLPGSYTQEDIKRLLTSSSEDVVAFFHRAKADDSLASLVDRIDDVYSSYNETHHIAFWKGVATFVKKPNCEWMTVYEPMHDVIRELAGVLERAVRRNPKLASDAARVFTNLRGEDNVLTAIWLRTHIFQHHLFNQSGSDSNATFLSKDQTEALAIVFSQEMRTNHLSHRLIPCRYDLQPVYTMVDTGQWDTVCQQVLTEDIESDAALDSLTLMLFGAEYTTAKFTLNKIIPYETYNARVKERIQSASFSELHETVKRALLKAEDPY